MSDRASLSAKFHEIIGDNVYYQPPESVKMNYPAIRYEKAKIRSDYADNKRYRSFDQYTVTVISKKADHEAIGKILDLPMSGHDRHYVADGMHHDVITLFY